jgi:hypothetical protein
MLLSESLYVNAFQEEFTLPRIKLRALRGAMVSALPTYVA